MTETNGAPPQNKRRKYIMGAIFLAAVIVASVFLVLNWEYIVRFQRYGYLGLFIMTIVTGFSIPLPMPYMVFTFTLGGILQPALVGGAAGLGLGIGGTLLYLTGRGGRRILPHFELPDQSSEANSSRWARFLRKIRVPKMVDFAKRRGAVAIFVLSAVPNPLFAPVAVSMGVMRYSIWRFFFACWGGSTVKTMALAYFGYLGLGSMLRWTGLFGIS